DANITYIYSKGDRTLYLDPDDSTILSVSPTSKDNPSSASATPPQAVQKLQRLQRKLRVGAADDQYEQEADTMADHVMRMPQPEAADAAVSPLPGTAIQRECSSCGEEEELQRKCATCDEEEQKLQRQCADCEQEEQDHMVQRQETGTTGAVA